jgi:16S rRNA processing protein RimM
MAYENYILIGRITRVNNYEGVVTVKLERYFSDNIPKLESVFIETDGRLVPFFVEFAEHPDNLTLRMQFSGYETDIKIKEFVGCSVFLPDTAAKLLINKDTNYLIDYKVISQDKIVIGTIIETIEHPGHVLLSIKSVSGKEILIPFHEDLIKGVDKRKKIINMIIPDGIGELN